jgi:glycosyltransferase involved in cell wall biosynthesis
LNFLKITLEKLLKAVSPDEEIVVVDGDSSDGSKEYLQTLFESGQIHQFISEPDRNQAHGWNKAMLIAKGTLIKKIIDDDVFCYPAIRKCKQYMLQNPQVDVVISNDLSSLLSAPGNISKQSRLLQFEKWRKHLTRSFTFGDVHMLIRRSSLANIGLYNTSFIMMDWEYSLRISYLKANICYYTGYNALNVAHPQTVSSLKNISQINEQGKRGGVFYEYVGDAAEINFYSKIKIWVGKKYFRLQNSRSAPEIPVLPSATELADIYATYYQYLEELNNNGEWEFIC